MNRIVLACLAAALWCVTLPAVANAPTQAQELCSGDLPRGCAINVADVTREGATYPVTIFGKPNTRIDVVSYLPLTEKGKLTDLVPLGDPHPAITNSSGVANLDVAIPTVPDHPSSGWILISVAGLEGTDTSLTVGSFVPFGARTPMLLGDGFAEDKPVGVPLTMQYVGAIRQTEFTVEYQSDDGAWHDITNEGATGDSPDAIGEITYTLPRGLTATPKQMRLTNRTDTSFSAVWLATPSVDGTPQPRDPVFVPPAVGDALDGTKATVGFPADTVQVTALGIGGVSVAIAAIGTLARRRP